MTLRAILVFFALQLLGCFGGPEEGGSAEIGAADGVESHEEAIESSQPPARWKWVTVAGNCDEACGCPEMTDCWVEDCGCTLDENWECSGNCRYHCLWFF